ncbi:MAG: DUF4252 domain-containing protein [Chloroherpetonaceae bacterium]|jgi:hypothetical protein|nr:DUF4252 domain-containing protein [bacterium]
MINRKLIMEGLFAILITLLPQIMLSADIEKIINEYSGKDGFTIVNIPGSSLGYVFNELNGGKTNANENDSKVKEIAKDITGIKILTYSKEEGGNLEPNIIYNKFIAAVDMKEYDQLMSVNKKDEKVMMLVKKDESNKVSEFLMITYGPGEATLIQISGKLNMKDIKNLTEPSKENNNTQKPKK